MSYLDTLEVFFDHNWVYRVDQTKVASLFGVSSVRIEKDKMFQRTYNFKDGSSGRLLFMVKRHTWKEANRLMDFITADKTSKITKVESYIYPCSRSCCYWIGDSQVTMILVNQKGIEFTALDCPVDKLILAANLFEEKKVF